jgi:5-oxoprolinase (ATP-hydrolysing)
MQGGTSTDVSRFGGKLEHVFESVTAGVTIQAPQLDISTVAAGGGSMLFYRNGLFVVGPDSASAHPGPACYRKGGPLTVTDANLFLGRLHVDSFPKIFGKTEDQPLDYEASAKLFRELTDRINKEEGGHLTPEEVACGFIDVANETMARPIRGLTEGRGWSTGDHNLSCFGGAGGQHASAIAAALGIHNVIVHKYSSVLSAYGMALADVAVDFSEPSSETYTKNALKTISPKIETLKQKALSQLEAQGVAKEDIQYEVYLNMRYLGSDTSMMILEREGQDFDSSFKQEHRREFSFNLDKPLIVDDVRVRGIGKSPELKGAGSGNFARDLEKLERLQLEKSKAFATQPIYFRESGQADCPIYRISDLKPGSLVNGPAIILDNTQTILVHPSNIATILTDHVFIDVGLGPRKKIDISKVDPILLSVFGSRFMSIAEQMGRTLQKTSISLQIKERLE